ncbi:hypothetical protein J3E74DRAFT_424921 [Bipolaris maydis]|nr:hypothetical protein J3E74DRAFT_424921 [Bipolaris maydis]
MDFLKRFTIQSSSPADNTPDPYADDDIYPVHVLDDTKALRSMLITCTFCFNNVLDANGKLEIHVPRAFTPSRPAFSYTHDSINTSIQDHELTRKLPLSPDGSIKISPGPTDFNDLAASPSAPATIEDLLSGDVPQISVHITSFTNATFVGLTWPHTLMDIIGQAALLQAWSRLLAGRDAEVPPVLDAQEDKLTALTNKATDAAEEYALKSKQLKGLSFVKFGARLAWDILTGTKPVTKTIYLPKSVMGKLRVRAEADLFASSNNDDNDNDDTIGEKEKPFISDGDILTAFTLDCIASSLPTPRQITALYPINSRFRLPSLINAKGVFLSNMSIPGFTFLGPAMSTGSLGQIALYNRQRLLEQATEAQILAILPVIRAGGDGRTGEENGSDSKRYNPPGTPVFYHASTRRPNPAARLLVNILGRDYSGGYWLTLTMSPGAWDKVEEGLKELS